MTKAKRIWLKNPLSILANQAENGLVIEDGIIAELVGQGKEPSQPCETIIDASQWVVIPGLINGHHHFYQTLTRALPQALNKPLFNWLKSLYPVWAGLEPEMVYESTRLALAELLLSGCTTAADHHYLFPQGITDAMDIQAQAASEMGLRMTMTRGSMSLSQDDGGLPPASTVQTESAIMADSERVIQRYHDASPGSMLQVALAPCSPFSVTPELMRETAKLAA
ncbi:MAG: amidohydrolase family protein, partial [Pseudomonadales bacterium]